MREPPDVEIRNKQLLTLCYEMLHSVFDLAGSLEQPRHWKVDTRFGTLNVRNLYRLGSLRAVARELARMREICENTRG
jgi:hypothetical protein